MRNILEIIKKMPEDRKLYSMVAGYGSFSLAKIETAEHPIILKVLPEKEQQTSYDEYGRLYHNLEKGECVIFPSKDCRDWNEWAAVLVEDGDIVALKDGKVVRFDYNKIDYTDIARFAGYNELTYEKKDEQPTGKAAFEPFKVKAILNPFDKVLVADKAGEIWQCNIFSHYIADADMPCKFRCLSNPWRLCIPFEGNENLVGQRVTEEQVAEINKIDK